ncbi:hypothetical protein F511_03428 [Dorcoceras hygrometricum]|uniref:EF-hand domain-containing protein n=1 Tax=Dorcoceras hygrometricum TaxID=472368 RepID=A0A2Z7DD96_9LAMI|nr:hypothetical protein F511_03428 [Dorcoceras hygrometricum]
MKLINMNPAKLFKQYKKSRSVSRSETDPSSFSSQTTSSSSCSYYKRNGSSTPPSVLPHWSHQLCFDGEGDRDGKVKKEELQALLCRLGLSQEDLRLMLTDLDTDGDGCISSEELYAIRAAFAPPSCELEMRDTFDFFDSDHDGRITAEELFQVFKNIGDAGCTMEDCRRIS